MVESVVRASLESDLAAITSIYAEHVRSGTATFEVDPPDAEEMGRRRSDVVGRGLPYLVAESGGTVVGFAYAAPYRPRAAYRYSLEDSIYLRADAQGRGLGKRLLAELLRLCEQGEWRQMIAVVGDSGNQASIRLHRALGFVDVGTQRAVGFKLGRWLDIVVLQRALGEGDRTLPR
jgi:phosphinothricin acetyltransferase